MPTSTSHHIRIGNLTLGNDLPLVIIAGPCQMESRNHAMEMAEALLEKTQKAGLKLIYKSSFDKANRSSIHGKRGLGMEKSLPVFAEIKEKFGCPVLTDVHNEAQCAPIAKVVDILQIPAFLCRQTDLLVAAAKTNAVVNIKKGQFLAPWDMKQVAEKVAAAGNRNIILTDRGTSFGYNNLVSDMRSFPIMKQTGYPVVVDATHSIQQPGGLGQSSGGQREFAPVIASAATAVGIAAVFMEVHQDPDTAPSDGPCMLKLDTLLPLLKKLAAIDIIAKRKDE